MNQETHSSVLQVLAEFSEFAQRIVEVVQQHPIPGSKAAAEFAAATSDERVALKTALSQARLYLLASDDALRGLERALHEPTLSVTPWICTRAVLESASLSCWLSQPSIDASERISRSVGIRFDSILNELHALGKGKTGNTDPVDDAPFYNLLATASCLGISHQRNKNKHLCQVGTLKPKFTQAIESELSMRSAYGHLSNMVHANPLTILGRLLRTSAVSEDDPDLREGMSEIQDEDILALSILAARGYLAGIKQLLLLLGYFVGPVADQLESYTRRLEHLMRAHRSA